MYRIKIAVVGLGVTSYCIWKTKTIFSKHQLEVFASSDPIASPYQELLPSRIDLLKELKNPDNNYDILVIGGGATGSGVALDACSRGLKTALVEKYDYAAGTSSRSTKLIHGGVRYLQKAILGLDLEQYRLVKEALHERANLLAIAPHIANPLPILLPVYKWWQVPYYWFGIKIYDVVAGRKLVKSSYFIGKQKTLDYFPQLNSKNLCGSIVYYDGQQDDARMNLSIALTAIRKGATCANHVEVKDLIFEVIEDGDVEKKRVCGARLCDNLTGEEWNVQAKCVINATGPFTDAIRKMDNKKESPICQPAAGVHITLPKYYCSDNMGLLDPATKDGRVVFFLPWEGRTIAGTTDSKSDVTYEPQPTEDEIEFILEEIRCYMNPQFKVRREDVLSAWSGIRPLVTDPSSTNTQSISRNHVVNVSESGLVTIAGGKWTTYRAMAKDAVDAALKANNQLQTKNECSTDGLLLEGADGWNSLLYIKLIQDYGLDSEVAQHLSHAYGSKSAEVLKQVGGNVSVFGKRLDNSFPFIEGEVLYAVQQEYACTAVDVIARRLRIAFLNTQAATDILPRVIQIMGDELKWDKHRRKKELEEATRFLQTMSS